MDLLLRLALTAIVMVCAWFGLVKIWKKENRVDLMAPIRKAADALPIKTPNIVLRPDTVSFSIGGWQKIQPIEIRNVSSDTQYEIGIKIVTDGSTTADELVVTFGTFRQEFSFDLSGIVVGYECLMIHGADSAGRACIHLQIHKLNAGESKFIHVSSKAANKPLRIELSCLGSSDQPNQFLRRDSKEIALPWNAREQVQIRSISAVFSSPP